MALIPERRSYTVEIYDDDILKSANKWIDEAMEIVEKKYPEPNDYPIFAHNILHVIIEDEIQGQIRVSFMHIVEIINGESEAHWEVGRIQILGKNPPYIQPGTHEMPTPSSRKPRKKKRKRPPIIR